MDYLVVKNNDMMGQDFHLIGIGVSEGGIEPLRIILSSLPIEPNAAFFVLNHLPPDLESFTARALMYHTTMPIHEAVRFSFSYNFRGLLKFAGTDFVDVHFSSGFKSGIFSTLIACILKPFVILCFQL
jgi:hypothetical protein